MSNQIQQNNYTKKEITYQLMLPIDVEVKIDAKESVRLLIEVTEGMDYSKLNAAYDRLPRTDEATPKQMYQLVILGFMEGIYSTRKLESACRNDIRFMYLLRGKRVPDHNRFRSFIRHRLQGEVAENLFYQLGHYLKDAGYESEENYKGLIHRGQTAYIKPQNYEKSKTRKYKTNAFLREHMPYNAEADTYTCPNGNTFSQIYTTKRRSKSGFESDVTVYECQGCCSCPKKKDCTRAKENRKISVSKDFIELRQASRERITSEILAKQPLYHFK